MIRRPPRSTQSRSSAASDVYKRQCSHLIIASCHFSRWPQLLTRGSDPRRGVVVFAVEYTGILQLLHLHLAEALSYRRVWSLELLNRFTSQAHPYVPGIKREQRSRTTSLVCVLPSHETLFLLYIPNDISTPIARPDSPSYEVCDHETLMRLCLTCLLYTSPSPRD